MLTCRKLDYLWSRFSYKLELCETASMTFEIYYFRGSY